MASTADFKNGMVIRYNHDMLTIVEFQHVKPGKGGAFVRTKLKNVVTGKVIDNTFRSGEKVEEVRVEARMMQYLYQDGDSFIFMDGDTYDQVPMGADLVSEGIAKYLKDGVEYKVLFDQANPIILELPNFLNLEIAETEHGEKGDRVSAEKKPATLETGAVIQVPLFVNIGDLIRVDTRTDLYVERVKA